MDSPANKFELVEPLQPKVAFVVHVTDNPPDLNGLRGRAEHVISGRSLRFSSLRQLAEFLAQVSQEETSK